ncbi:helix-turn-helix transcriptional regulator [Sorangium sp. So ce385]|uniref:helix-turn-helix transcriptional regulator n=1 Tax=Sorangium sp. So ce385 TaxID=3133308 RepID=UPI003F5BBCA1
MGAVTLDGSDADLDRFADRVLNGATAVEALSPVERQMRWDIEDRAGFTRSTALRSGIGLTVTKLRWERPWSLALDHGASRLKFVVVRGPGPRLTTSAGELHRLDGGTFHVSQIKRPVRLRFDFDDRAVDRDHEQLSLEIDRARLSELLGTKVLPAAVERVLASPRAYPSDAQPVVPALFQLIDELVHCDARGASRQLYLEAKGLELLAVMVDRLEESERAASSVLSTHDVDRLERARQIVLARMDDPPRLPDLARLAGLNEAKLKAGFRALFGDTVYGYLRDRRLDEAHRLLRQRRYSVSEVAARVGYANPSKFAAAFRERFGVPPSQVT